MASISTYILKDYECCSVMVSCQCWLLLCGKGGVSIIKRGRSIPVRIV